MAITRINALNNTGACVTGVGTISLSGLTILAGDVLVVAVNVTSAVDRAFTLFNGNTNDGAIFADLYSDDTSDTNLGGAIIVQGAVVDTSVTFTVAGAGSSVFSYNVIQYRGVDTTTPQDVAATTATGIDTDAANPPAITPTTAGARIVATYAAALRAGGSAWAAPAVVGNFIQATTADAHPVRVATADVEWTAGAFDPAAVVSTAATPLSSSWCAATIALRPVAEQPPTPSPVDPALANIRSIQWVYRTPSSANVSGWTGTGTFLVEPWRAKWFASVELAPIQGEAGIRAVRGFLAKRKGQLVPFRIPATEGQQNGNSGVTVSSTAAAGATSMSLSGYSESLLDGQFVTVNAQLLCLTADQSGASISFRPPLRQAASAGTRVVTSRPYAFVYMASARSGWSVGPWRLFNVSFEAEEAILETDPDTVPEA